MLVQIVKVRPDSACSRPSSDAAPRAKLQKVPCTPPGAMGSCGPYAHDRPHRNDVNFAARPSRSCGRVEYKQGVGLNSEVASLFIGVVWV